MMLIGSLIAVKGSSLIPRIWELETFSGEHKIERLAETEDKQPSNPYPLIPFPKVLPPKAAPKLLQQSSPLQSPPLRSRPLTGLLLKLPLSQSPPQKRLRRRLCRLLTPLFPLT
jgi:hypothetical protein